MDAKLKSLIEFIAEASSGEAFPSPVFEERGRIIGLKTQHVIYSTELCDKIAELWGLKKEEIGAIVNPIANRMDAR